MTASHQLLLIANEAELYGIDLSCVQEIRVYQPLTRLPHAPSHVIGILNVGGQILPVIDLRYRLWERKTNAGAWHLIVLVRKGDAHCGILVDRANEIAELSIDQIDMPEPSKSGCFAGIGNFTGTDGKGPEQPVAILDIEAIAGFTLGTFRKEAGLEEISYV